MRTIRLTEDEARYVVDVLLELRGMALNDHDTYTGRDGKQHRVCRDCKHELAYSRAEQDIAAGHAPTCPRKLRYAVIGKYERMGE